MVVLLADKRQFRFECLRVSWSRLEVRTIDAQSAAVRLAWQHSSARLQEPVDLPSLEKDRSFPPCNRTRKIKPHSLPSIPRAGKRQNFKR